MHVPFCRSKCRYCGFVSYPYRRQAAAAYLEAVGREMAGAAAGLRRGCSFASVYVGGGTPTSLPPADLVLLLNRIQQLFAMEPGAEVTVEANPDTVDDAYLRALRKAGVNRLSLGAQSFDPALLRLLGRRAGPGAVTAAVRAARAAGFTNLNLDLIFGLPGQTPAVWRQTIARALDLAPEHVSAYDLELVEGTPLARAVEEGRLAPCPEEDALEMYEEAISTLTRAGYRHYEISNFALAGRECRHNLLYWENDDYLGFGPAAASHWRGTRRGNAGGLEAYVRGEGDACEGDDPAREMTDTVIMGLRLTAGLDLEAFARRFGVALTSVYPGPLEMVQRQGLAEIAGGRLRLTKRGLPLANEVFRAFV